MSKSRTSCRPQGRSSYEHYLISEDIKVCATKGDLRTLRKIVRRNRRERGPSPLNFDPINCCNWLNKYVLMTARPKAVGLRS